MKQFLPKSLFFRTLLIVVMPVVLLQIVLGYFFFTRHTETILRQLSKTIAGDVAFIVEEVKHSPYKKAKERASTLDLNLTMHPDSTLDKVGPYKEKWLYEFLDDALAVRLQHPYFFRIKRDFIFIDIAINEKDTLSVSMPKKRLFSRTTYYIIIWALLSTLVLFTIAILFLRNQLKPLTALEDAAEKIGKGELDKPLPIYGATEIRKVTVSFNQMRARIERYIHDRLQILSDITHDLRTPLEQMDNNLKKLPKDKSLAPLQKNINQIQRILDNFSALTQQSETQIKQPHPIASTLTDILTKTAGKNLNVHFTPENNQPLSINLLEFTTAIENIVLNANKYSKNLWVECKEKTQEIVINFEDDGPGVQDSEKISIFDPTHFFKKNNKNTYGQGLSFVKDTMQTHGGKIILTKSKHGGLKISLKFPI